MKIKFIILFVSFIAFGFSQTEQVIPSIDGVLIHGKLYANTVQNSKVMLQCHQSNYSKGEYNETAPKLKKMGYTCLAIDQRSSICVNGDVNLTARGAKYIELSTTFDDAKQDIRSALYFLFEKYERKIILFGSSYSAALVLKIAASEKDKVEMVITFSPGEYLHDEKTVNKSLQKINMPFFITCSQEEIKNTTTLLDGVDNKKMVFLNLLKKESTAQKRFG